MFERYLRIALFGVMLLCVSAALNAAVMEYIDATGTIPIKVSAANPLPVTGSTGGTSATVDSAGASYVAPKGATSAASTRWLITSSGQAWTLSASATDFTLFNLGSNTVWFDLNMGGATVGASIPLTATGTGQAQQGRDAASGMVVNLIAATPTYVLGVEGRR